MTPKEKAKELYRMFYIAIPSDEMGLCDNAAKECALIAVDEILNANHNTLTLGHTGLAFWMQVKQEIEKL